MPLDPIRFAPFMRFDREERHFLARPEGFRENCRFRFSRDSEDDLGWNRRDAVTWKPSDAQGPDYTGPDWKTVSDQVAVVTKQEGVRTGPITEDGPVTRPQDERNVWARGRRRGFFLELKEGFGHDDSGQPPVDLVPGAPVFCDLYPCTDRRGRTWSVLAYWFFYVYNWNKMFKHEGDWEHISLYFLPEAGDEFPRLAYYAAHDAGFLISGRSPIYVPDDADDKTIAGPPAAGVTHPTVFVLRQGHPSFPVVDDSKRYDRCARAWEGEIIPLDREEWHVYDGAWGEVGEFFGHTTGPLGPWFKRGRDAVRLERFL